MVVHIKNYVRHCENFNLKTIMAKKEYCNCCLCICRIFGYREKDDRVFLEVTHLKWHFLCTKEATPRVNAIVEQIWDFEHFKC